MPRALGWLMKWFRLGSSWRPPNAGRMRSWSVRRSACGSPRSRRWQALHPPLRKQWRAIGNACRSCEESKTSGRVHEPSRKNANPIGPANRNEKEEKKPMGVKGKCAIAGLGVTPMGKIYGRSATDFALEAIELALADAGLQTDEVDGLLINANMSREMNTQLQAALWLENLSLLNVMNVYGSTAGTMIQYASMAIENGLANVVVLVYAGEPLKPAQGAGDSYTGSHMIPMTGMERLRLAYGLYVANPSYAMAARRHIHP